MEADEEQPEPSHLAKELRNLWSWATCLLLWCRSWLRQPPKMAWTSRPWPGLGMEASMLAICRGTCSLTRVQVQKHVSKGIPLTFLLPHKLFAKMCHSLPSAFSTSLLGGDAANIQKLWTAMESNPTFLSRPLLQQRPDLGRLELAKHGPECGRSSAGPLKPWPQVCGHSGTGTNKTFEVGSIDHANRGAPLAEGFAGVVFLLRSDLEFLANHFGMSHPSSNQPCALCQADRDMASMPWTDCRVTAAWRGACWEAEAMIAVLEASVAIETVVDGLRGYNVSARQGAELEEQVYRMNVGLTKLCRVFHEEGGFPLQFCAGKPLPLSLGGPTSFLLGLFFGPASKIRNSEIQKFKKRGAQKFRNSEIAISEIQKFKPDDQHLPFATPTHFGLLGPFLAVLRRQSSRVGPHRPAVTFFGFFLGCCSACVIQTVLAMFALRH